MSRSVREIAAARLRRLGHRYTRNRHALVEVLAGAEHPLTIHEIIERHAELAQSSVYRNLAILERANVAHRIVTSDEYARYELAEDLTDHHHHLICVNCGRVEDFAASPRLERSAALAFARIASRAGFTVESHRLDLIGRCRRCA